MDDNCRTLHLKEDEVKKSKRNLKGRMLLVGIISKADIHMESIWKDGIKNDDVAH